MKYRFYFAIFVAALALSQPASALNLEKYGVGYGFLNSGMLSESVDETGASSFLGSFTFHFLALHSYWRGERFRYGLRLGYTVIPRESTDGAAKISQLILSPQFGVPFGSSGKWMFNSGLGILRTESKGQGGTVELNNGTSTRTFFLPSDTVSSILINLETGLEYDITPEWSVSGDLLFNGLLGEKRNMSLYVRVAYSWGNSFGNQTTSFGGGY